MLRYDGIDAFEKWLRQCPLDPRSLTYSTARTGDGMLNVQCVWRMPGNLSAPNESCEHAAGCVAATAPTPTPAPARDDADAAATTGDGAADAEADADEIGRMKATMARIQQMMPPGAAALMSSLTSDDQPAGGQTGTPGAAGAGGAALAMALLQQRLERSATSSAPPSSDEVRAALSMCSGGVPFPKPPGASFE